MSIFQRLGFGSSPKMRMLLLVCAVTYGIIGCLTVFTVHVQDGRWYHIEPVAVDGALPWWFVAMFFAAAAAWSSEDMGLPVPQPNARLYPVNWPLAIAAMPPLVGAYTLQDPLDFTPAGVACWVVGLLLLCAAFLVGWFSPLVALRRIVLGPFHFIWLHPWTFAGLLAVMCVATFARFFQLEAVPSELTHDHTEKLMDVQRLMDGQRPIFFGTNGGREAIHMYFLALLTPVSGGVNFWLLKIGAAIHSVLGVLAFYFLGVALVGEDSPRARQYGLLLALMGAVGFWHLMVTRVSLRIMLAPLIVTLVMWALVRVIRYNRREDAVMAGLLIGAGFYGYQSLRFAPFLAVIAVGLCVIWVARTWAERRRYVANLVVMAVVSFAVFIPSLHYWVHNPNVFWSRAISTVTEEGLACNPEYPDTCADLSAPVLRFAENMLEMGGMFTYRGDKSWPYNPPGYPALDPLGGSLFMVGLSLGVVQVIRRRDAVGAFVVLGFVLMLTPSAITLAKPNEIPGFTRSAGAMPMTYAFIALGLMYTLHSIAALMPREWRPLLVMLPMAVAYVSFGHAWQTLSTAYLQYSHVADFSLREIGERVRLFAEEKNLWGNTFYVFTEYHVDLRNIMIEAGLPPGEFENFGVWVDEVPVQMYRRWLTMTQYRLDLNHDMLFIFAYHDTLVREQMKEWFPSGRETVVHTRQDTPWIPNEPRIFFYVPPMDEATLQAFLKEQMPPPPR